MREVVGKACDLAFKAVSNTRVSAFVIVLTCATLCRATVILVRASYMGRSVLGELGVVVGALSVLAGYAYGRNKLSKERGNTSDSSKRETL